MNLKKYSNQINDKNVLKNNCTFIEIKHYEKDKLLKTETYPLTHFLEGFENEFKRMKIPVLLAVGDEDELCLEINIYLKTIYKIET